MSELNKQLLLTKKQLRDIGFKRCRKDCYEIECLNGNFICNINDPIYKWYQQITIGNASNFINLDIKSAAELQIILSAFKVKFNLTII